MPISSSNAEIQMLLQECKQMSKSIKTPRPSRFLSCPEPIVLQQAMADHLVHLYESNIESAFRILHRSTFRSEYEKYKICPTEIADVTILKIQLVIAIGSSLCPNMSDSIKVRRLACQWLHAAQDWLSGPIEKDRLSIDSIQVHCLLILARQVLSVGGDLSWVSMGVLLRTAMQIGLHRDPKHFLGMSNFEGEIRRRLWATILELNAQASLDSGTPCGISFDDFDTTLPANINDEDIGAVSTGIRHHNDATQTDTSLQRFLLQCLPPRLEVIRRMNSLNADLQDEHILELSAKLSAACREVDEQTGTSADHQASSFKRNIGSFLLRRFLLILHRPLAGRIRENALYYHSRKMSFDSAMALLKPPLKNDAFSYLMLHGGGLIKSCLIHASLALASELLIEIEEQGSSTYRGMLIDAVKEAQQRWEKRIELGDTGFRLHMKLNIVLGLSEHTRETDQQHRMVHSTKGSLELCRALIRKHVGSELSVLSSECDDWRNTNLHPIGNNEHLNLSSQSLDFENILQMSGPDIGGDFEPDSPTFVIVTKPVGNPRGDPWNTASAKSAAPKPV
ncbi:hypothetical protein NPX13_g6015 [Xylaria arbuscula]|uniref:Xylanolytic transcriptional activator regulatory domain-containing protein n=1 Tax=Xylaria arbuscula TaxID=114810 RepID=A0A9W8TMJ6_9PEZI|nr:hypothetical protein NPX13_g6015 [Xylaria arbuscula]